MNKNLLLGIALQNQNIKEVLEKCKKYMYSGSGFVNIVSVNPENVVTAVEDNEFKMAVNTAQIRINDGVGIVIAAQMLGLKAGDRITGSDLMVQLLDMAGKERLGVLLIGGKANLAEDIAKCYQAKYPEANFFGLAGFKDIQKPTNEETGDVFSIVAVRKPSLLLVAFGSPAQELWIDKNKERLKGIVCMGVGGGFDYLSGSIKRANPFIRAIGLEWLFRLVKQPWRWRRQLRLVKFVYLVVLQKMDFFKQE